MYFNKDKLHEYEGITKIYTRKNLYKPFATVDEANILSLKSLNIDMNFQDQLYFTINNFESSDDKKSMLRINKQKMGLSLFDSAYSTAYRDIFKKDRSNQNIVNNFINTINKEDKIEKFTFESPYSHIAHNFRATVDYIW